MDKGRERCRVAGFVRITPEAGFLACNLLIEQSDGAAEPGEADSFPGAGVFTKPKSCVAHGVFRAYDNSRGAFGGSGIGPRPIERLDAIGFVWVARRT